MPKRIDHPDSDPFDDLLREGVKDPPSLLVPGTRLQGGRFVIQKLLGSGGMGVVYDAVDTEHDTRVVIKTLLRLSGDALYHLKREFRALADIAHPNLVTLYELVIDEKNWFYTMEPVDGVDFVSHVNRHSGGRGVDTARLSRALQQLCDGLSALHNVGKVHRDIKPSNVLVTHTGRVVILDFGMISDLTHDETLQSTQGVWGTLVYMSPEQAMAKPVTPAADWYSVGVMLYQCLTGGLPFKGENLQMLLHSQTYLPAPPHEVVPETDRTLSRLAMALLSRDPLHRPEAKAIQQATRNLVSSIPFAVSPPLEEPHFIGRTEELETLHRAWHQANRKRTLVAATIQGDSGIGKSALIERFTGLLRDGTPRPLVLRGRCFERESVPYKAFDVLVDGMTQFLRNLEDPSLQFALPKGVRYTAALFPVLNRLEGIREPSYVIPDIPDPNERRRRGIDNFCELVENISRLRPLILVIDDLQWSDEDSLMLLRELIQSDMRGPVFLLLAYRDENPAVVTGASTLVREMDPERVAAIHLFPLDDDVSLRLVGEILDTDGAQNESRANTLVREANGNPYYLLELSRLVAASGTRQVDLRGGLSRVVALRFEGLSTMGKRLLRLISVAGDALPKPLLCTAVGLNHDNETFAQELMKLSAEHLIRNHGPRILDAVVTSHDKVRETVLEITDKRTIREYHRLLAEAAEAMDMQNADFLARQLVGAGNDEQAYLHVQKAAEVADAQLAFDRAAELYRTALTLTGNRAAQVALGEALGNALANAGHPGQAAEAYFQAATQAEELKKVVLLRSAAEQWLRAGYITRGATAIQQIFDDMGFWRPRFEAGLLASLLYHRFLLKLRGRRSNPRSGRKCTPRERIELDTLYTLGTGLDFIHPVRSQELLLRFALKALDHGDDTTTALAMSWIRFFNAAYAISTVAPDRPFFTIPEKDDLFPDAQQNVLFQKVVNIYIEMTRGHWQATVDNTSRELEYVHTRCHGKHRELARLRWCRCIALLHQGALRELNVQVKRYLLDAVNAGDEYARANFLSNFSVVWLADDDLDQAESDIRDLLTSWAKGYHTLVHCLCATATCGHTLYRSEGVNAFESLEGHMQAIVKSKYINVIAYRVYLTMVRARAALMAASQSTKPSNRRRFIETARHLARQLEGENLGYTAAWSALIQTGVLCQEGRVGDDLLIQQFDTAIRQLEATDCQAYAAATRRQKGLFIGGDQGGALVTEAQEWFSSQGIKKPARFAEMLVPNFKRP